MAFHFDYKFIACTAETWGKPDMSIYYEFDRNYSLKCSTFIIKNYLFIYYQVLAMI